MIEDLFQEGLHFVRLNHPKIYPTLVLYLNGATLKEISTQRSLGISNTRREIQEGKKYLSQFLEAHSITMEFILDGRSVPRPLFGKVNLLFPSFSKKS